MNIAVKSTRKFPNLSQKSIKCLSCGFLRQVTNPECCVSAPAKVKNGLTPIFHLTPLPFGKNSHLFSFSFRGCGRASKKLKLESTLGAHNSEVNHIHQHMLYIFGKPLTCASYYLTNLRNGVLSLPSFFTSVFSTELLTSRFKNNKSGSFSSFIAF